MLASTYGPPDHAELRSESPRPSIAASGLTKSFVSAGGVTVNALGPIDLSIEEGAFTCIVGPSGCGKSTFLKIIAGLLSPTSGEVTVTVEESARSALAMVFQDYGIYPWKTVRANVELGLRLAGEPKHSRRLIVDDWLGRLGIQDFGDAYPSELSGGMKQRVSIARALALDPAILLMDEPFAALDAQLREIMQDELLGLWQTRRRTVVFVTHSLEEAILLGDRVIVMGSRPGRIIANIEVPFKRPRTGDIRNDARFGQLRQNLWDGLKAQVGPAEGRD